MVKKYYCDMHIHIGEARGNPVKITASRKLNFANIAEESYSRKGLDLIGIIDCASPPVIEDIEELLIKGEMEELKQGGIKYRDLVIIPGAEIESKENNGGQAHYLAYFPFLENIKEFSLIMKQYITNINLSSQATGLTGSQILQIVDNTGGTLIPAHGFTPHKSFYGRCVSSYKEIFNMDDWEKIPGIELGLSADTELADHLSELGDKSFLSNSDAHSLSKIAREYNVIQMENLNYEEFIKALKNKGRRRIISNFGMDPRLGKYHRSYCNNCDNSFPRNKAVLKCPQCNHKDKLTVGVKDRILRIGDKPNTETNPDRPEYIHQVPLLDIPGIGNKTLEKLLQAFGTEMEIIHQTELEELEEVVSEKIAQKIEAARTGKIKIKSGGGGEYGRVMG